MNVLQLLAQDNFITYNKSIAKEFGVNAAILLGALCSYQIYFQNEEFYKEQGKISEDTCLSEYEIQQALKILKQNELVIVTKKGLPAKNYYKINDNKLFELLTTSGQNFRPLEVEILDHINNNNTINKNKNINNNICPVAVEILNYLNEKAGTHFKPVDSNLKFINARLKDYTADDLKRVVDLKVKDWKGTQMQQYLRPETLFNATKFETYANGLKEIKEDKPQEFIHNNYTEEQKSGFYADLEKVEL